MADSDYSDAFELDTRDLVAEARDGALAPVRARDADVDAVLDLLERGRSVLLVGESGAGKTAIVHAVARRLAEDDEPDEALGLRQTSTTQLMSRTRYLGEWESKVTAVCRRAADEGTALYVTDAWSLPDAGRGSSSQRNMLDAMAPWLEDGRLLLVAEARPEQVREMERHPLLLAHFHQHAVAPLEPEVVDELLADAAARLALDLGPEARKRAVTLTSTFGRRRTQPGPALELFEQVRTYLDEKRAVGEDEPVTPGFVEKVFAIYSGLPLFVVSPTETRPAREIREWFTERIVGQREAIEAVVETIALFKAGLQDPQRPIGTFLFVGPTGVGKTELARALATFLFGSPRRLLRFDLSEFKDFHAFEMLLGTPREPRRPARLVDPVRAHPFQVVLFDELEKAHQNVWDLLLPLLDEGRLTTPLGQTVDFRNTILIATSNVGASGADRSLGFGAEDARGAATARRARMMEALEQAFRPEFLNRFQHVAVFHPLDPEQVRRVARQELERVFARDGITGRNLLVDVDDATLDQIVARGYDARYGARALKRELQHRLVRPLAMTLLERAVEPGSLLRVRAKEGHARVTVVETAESRASKRARLPAEPRPGRVLDRDGALRASAELAARLVDLARAVDEPYLELERERLTALRAEPEFWSDPVAAARDVRDLGWTADALDRLEALRERLEGLQRSLVGDSELDPTARQLVALEDDAEAAWRELVRLGRGADREALIEITPLGAAGREARDLVTRTYLGWAEGRRPLQVLREPRADDEPVLISVGGPFAYGLLRHEVGLHRLRDGELHSAARVTVAPWTEERGELRYDEHVALKATGQLGGRIRSRLVCGGLVLQNERTLAENRDLATTLAPSWAAAATGEDVVRRIDRSPFKLRDAATGITSGRAESLGPEGFERLLAQRVDAMDETREGDS